MLSAFRAHEGLTQKSRLCPESLSAGLPGLWLGSERSECPCVALSVFLPWHFLDQVSVLSHNEAASVSQMNPYVCPIILHAAARLFFEKTYMVSLLGLLKAVPLWYYS